MRRSKITTEQIKEDFKEIHEETYDYSLVEYRAMHTKVKIICSLHGEFEQTPNAHFRLQQGCKKCAIISNSSTQRDTTDSFISKAKQIHGDKYDYSLVEYGQNAHEKVNIICREHGVFYMSPNSHLSKKSGCQECMQRHTGWTKTSWKAICEGKIAKLYIIRCYNEQESFYKIGITSKDTLEERFYHSSVMPYEYEIVNIISSQDDPVYIYDLERALHTIHKKVKYTPLISFAGDTECFEGIINYAEIH